MIKNLITAFVLALLSVNAYAAKIESYTGTGTGAIPDNTPAGFVFPLRCPP